MRRLFLFLPALLLSACAAFNDQPRHGAMVAAADPRAVEAGLDVLRKGGNAMDAAIAVQAMLGLVEPQSSGLGGGAFLLYWDADEEKLVAYDGREEAPASATPGMFLSAAGTPLGMRNLIPSGKVIGIPGAIAMLAMAHAEHGRSPWSTLFDASIAAARDGFVVSKRMAASVKAFPSLQTDPASREYFWPDGEPLAEGAIRTNAAYAQTLEAIAADPRAFYEGAIADAIIEAAASAPLPAIITREELAAYRPVARAPLCGPYRIHRVCSMGPPSSGGTALLQIVGMLERFPAESLQPGTLSFVHLLSEATRLAYADRAIWIGDPDVIDVPVAALTDRTYLAARSILISEERAIENVAPGDPLNAPLPFGAHVRPSENGTSHITIVDGDGNIVAMTTTIEGPFGAQVMAAGFLLNNELTDFSFAPENNGLPVANAPAPGKRPRSSMTPTIVFDAEGTPVLALGSPGGSQIIGYVAQTLVAILDGGLTPQEAVSLPRHNGGDFAITLEEGSAVAELKPALEAMGHRVQVGRLTSGLHVIAIAPDHLTGGADPRREGVAVALPLE
ncbi:MAG TPA: gamma-glutamyltransferase [Micropepsaceae bacterium]|nr:gamma-glutamyltransferase [Micropepsaceae bacterium]